MGVLEQGLFERERELGEIAAALERVEAGAGVLVLIIGEAGIGKSSLLAHARDAAERRGWTALGARASELEQGVPFGLAGELLAPVLNDPPPVGSEANPASLFAILKDLHRACAALASERPLLLALDDVQWADEESLRWLAFVARRLPAAPIALMCASRLPQPATIESVRVLVPQAAVLRPRPLTAAAAARIVRGARGEDAAQEFCDACHEASAGNPFYLRELVGETAAQAIPAAASSATLIRGLTTDTIKASTLLRLRQLGADAVALAQAIAILGIHAEVHDAAALASVGLEHAQALADAMTVAGLLRAARPLDFAHPVIRATVYADLAPGRRATLHLAAARILHERGAADDAVANHLMLCDPAGEDWAALALHEAARRAFARGAPGAARRLAARALREPPPTDRRGLMLTLMARAEMLTGDAGSVGHLQAAMQHAADARERIDLMLDLLEVIESRRADSIVDGEPIDHLAAVRSLRTAIAPHDEDAAMLLTALLRTIGQSGAAREQRADCRRRLRALTGRGVKLRGWPEAILGYMSLRDGEDAAATCVAYAREVLPVAGPRAESRPWRCAIDILIDCDEPGAAAPALAAALADARDRGSDLGVMLACNHLALLHLSCGRLAEAEHAAREGLEVSTLWDEPNLFLSQLSATLIVSLSEQGQLAAAEQAFRQAEAVAARAKRRAGGGALDVLLLYARGWLRLAAGDPAGAAEDLCELGRSLMEWGVGNPAAWDWAPPAVRALLAAGRPVEARTLAEDNLRRARPFGAPGTTGCALLCLGLCEEGPARAALLEEAIELLDATERQLDRAAAHVELGIALRHGKARTRAREALRAGLDLAERCGARPLAARAREELRIAGAKPRRDALSGVESLTASELRVAELAAHGLTNREIAGRLFLTMKTVAFHLSNAYRKLDVASRTELGEALHR